MTLTETPASVEALHNTHEGERCFILGTGPSLLKHDSVELAKLASWVTFGVSRLFLWKEMPFVPTYHVIREWAHIQNLSEVYWPGVQQRFVLWKVPVDAAEWTWVPSAPNEEYLVWSGVKGMEPGFEPFANGRSSVLSALQLALWMGFTTVYLTGCDITNTGHAWKVDEARNAMSMGNRYREGLPFQRAAQEMVKHGRSLYDCTPDGWLGKAGLLTHRDLAEVINL